MIDIAYLTSLIPDCVGVRVLGDGYEADLADGTARAVTEQEIAAAEAGPVPVSVTRYQARAWVFARGLSLALWATAAEMDAFMVGAIDAFPGLSQAEKELAKIKWAEAGAVERFDPLVAALGPVLGLNGQPAIDDALREATTL